MHLVYWIPPLRYLLEILLRISKEQQNLHPKITAGNFDWLVIPADSASGFVTDWIIGAREAKIKTLLAIDNWDHLTSKAIYTTRPDYITVMGKRCVEHAVSIHNFDSKNVLPFGLPRFDFYKRQLNDLPTKTHGSPKRILYCGFSLAHSEITIVNQLAEHFKSAIDSDELEICYRPHPGPLRRLYDAPRIDPRVKVTDHGDLSRTSLPNLNQEFLEALTKSDLVIAPPTSIVLEALLIGRPCLIDLTDDGFHRTTAAISARRHTHMLDLVQIGALPVSRTIEDLLSQSERMVSSGATSHHHDLSQLCDFSDPCYADQLTSFLTNHHSHSSSAH
jgi:hypothetical protein